MKWPRPDHLKSQDGYTLIEVIVASAIGALLLGALVSVFLTTMRATGIATSRVEASGQIQNFEYFAYEDFAGSNVSDLTSGCTPSSPCTSAITLSGIDPSNPGQTYPVSYTWDKSKQLLARQAGGGSINAAIDVNDFWWYVDANNSVVVNLTVSVGAYNDSQTFRFYPRRNP
jgi:prepilin-type N-terminal cleavage/methylation domain-containing protein